MACMAKFRWRTSLISPTLCRCIYSQTGIWEKKFTKKARIEVEDYWKKQLRIHNDKNNLSVKDNKDKFYVLAMFPYPSGRLHMGHVRVYTISDTIAHYQRLNNKQVLHPMGWDAFGLPAENAAIERQLPPDKWTYSNIEYMRKQLHNLSMCFDWDTEVFTCREDYYKWTQYLFVRLFHAGLVHQKMDWVNWDPVDHTVLANEQVDEQGCSWRSGAKVERRLLKQWFVNITPYSKSLRDGLDELPNWNDGIRSMQANWLTDCTGCAFKFKLKVNSTYIDDTLSVYTDNPELIYGAAFIILKPSHLLLHNKDILDKLPQGQIHEQLSNIEELSVLQLDITAEHPFTKETVPIFVANDDRFTEHYDALIGIPCGCQDDVKFARNHNLDYREVLDRREGDEDLIVHSDQFSGMMKNKAKEVITSFARQHDIGGHMSSPRQFHWLISRQRYWGTPIPIIHCPKCKAVPVPHDHLPVKLPKLASLSGKGLSPLSQISDWIDVDCPQCGGKAKRETDTMDTFVDSAWYFLRFCDPHNAIKPFDSERANQLMPVDLYVGGKEHAIMHLLYARFVTHFLHSEGMIEHKEPFQRLLVQGLVMGQTFRVDSTGQYISKDQVEFSDQQAIQKGSGLTVTAKWEKMSKSKHNGVDPEDTVESFGIDTTRLFMLSGIPPDHNMLWNTEAISGIVKWKNRLWTLVTQLIEARQKQEIVLKKQDFKHEEKIRKERNIAVEEVTRMYSEEYMFSVAISRLQKLSNLLRKAPDSVIQNSAEFEQTLCDICIMLAPMAPHFTSELWKGLSSLPSHLCQHYQWDQDILNQSWPVVKETIIEEPKSDDLVTLLIQINNIKTGRITVPYHIAIDSDKAAQSVLDSDIAQSHLHGKDVDRTILGKKGYVINVITKDHLT
ncbi:putative leucine--tRNA ligase, mitochondrial [Glandiceps talaboti]